LKIHPVEFVLLVQSRESWWWVKMVEAMELCNRKKLEEIK
jgi:hypothetical protein